MGQDEKEVSQKLVGRQCWRHAVATLPPDKSAGGNPGENFRAGPAANTASHPVHAHFPGGGVLGGGCALGQPLSVFIPRTTFKLLLAGLHEGGGGNSQRQSEGGGSAEEQKVNCSRARWSVEGV